MQVLNFPIVSAPTGVSLPSGWSFPTANGPSATTDFAYDSQGRLVQTLGPEHLAEVGTTATEVRTASWTWYDDADHETFSAQGYATQDTGGAWTLFTQVNPVSIEVTNADGQPTQAIEAAIGSSGWAAASSAATELYLGTQSPLTLLASLGLPSQADDAAWCSPCP